MFRILKRLSNGEKLYLVKHTASIDYEPTPARYVPTAMHEEIVFMSEAEAQRTKTAFIFIAHKRDAEQLAIDLKGEVDDAKHRRPD